MPLYNLFVKKGHFVSKKVLKILKSFFQYKNIEKKYYFLLAIQEPFIDNIKALSSGPVV